MPPAVTSDVAIRATRLVRSYGSLRALDDVSFAMATGSLCALLGPNGAGKTTLSECISGFRRPDSGSVQVLGRNPVADRGEVSAALGVMLQEGGAYPAATPREILDLYAGFYRSPVHPGDLLDIVGLASRADTRYRRLSGGQKQRLNLALALVGRPRVLVLDEPTAAMDPQGRQVTWDLLRRLRGEGVGVLFTTHDLAEAERLADRVLVMDRGRIVADGAPSELAAAADPQEVLVTTPARIDAAALARDLGTAVRSDGNGRWVVAAGATAIPAITAWFARQQLPVTGVSTTGTDLESVFARLVAAPSGQAGAGRIAAGRPRTAHTATHGHEPTVTAERRSSGTDSSRAAS